MIGSPTSTGKAAYTYADRPESARVSGNHDQGTPVRFYRWRDPSRYAGYAASGDSGEGSGPEWLGC